jgi:hypothetical protein
MSTQKQRDAMAKARAARMANLNAANQGFTNPPSIKRPRKANRPPAVPKNKSGLPWWSNPFVHF